MAYLTIEKISLSQYAVAGYKGPTVLLVHGFGAFLEHYRDNFNHIAEEGKRVWAITLLGFGRSEKPNVVYTELMWAILVRDFIIEVVGEPVHVVGNSIGGMLLTLKTMRQTKCPESNEQLKILGRDAFTYLIKMDLNWTMHPYAAFTYAFIFGIPFLLPGYFAAIVAGLWPYLAKSLVLLNSAGNIIPEFSAVNYSDVRVLNSRWILSFAFRRLFCHHSPAYIKTARKQ